MGHFCGLSREKHRGLYLLFKTSNLEALNVYWFLLPVPVSFCVLDPDSSNPALLCWLSGADKACGPAPQNLAW